MDRIKNPIAHNSAPDVAKSVGYGATTVIKYGFRPFEIIGFGAPSLRLFAASGSVGRF